MGQDVAGVNFRAHSREERPEARGSLSLGEPASRLEIEDLPGVVEGAAEPLQHAVPDVAGENLAADATAGVEREGGHRLDTGEGSDTKAVEPTHRGDEPTADPTADHIDRRTLVSSNQIAGTHTGAVHDEV